MNAAALAALIAYNDQQDTPTEDIDNRITDLIAHLADMAGDPNATLDAARERLPRRFYRNPHTIRQDTATALAKHYLAAANALSKAANYAHAAVTRAINNRNEPSRQRNQAKWDRLVEQRRAASSRLTAAHGARAAASTAWLADYDARYGDAA